ncbi:MAG: hypothetical protein RL095_1485 [Verrucomicrobiota bacterium]|jgi:hypothetical protein
MSFYTFTLKGRLRRLSRSFAFVLVLDPDANEVAPVFDENSAPPPAKQKQKKWSP